MMKLQPHLGDKDLSFSCAVSRTDILNTFHTVVKVLHGFFVTAMLNNGLFFQ